MLNLKVKERAKPRVILSADEQAIAVLADKIAASRNRLSELDTEIATEVREGNSTHA